MPYFSQCPALLDSACSMSVVRQAAYDQYALFSRRPSRSTWTLYLIRQVASLFTELPRGLLSLLTNSSCRLLAFAPALRAPFLLSCSDLL